jgi:hypothetical protein
MQCTQMYKYWFETWLSIILGLYPEVGIYSIIVFKCSKNKPSYMWSSDFWQLCQDHSMGRGQSFQQRVVGKWDIHIKLNEPLPNTTYKNQLKVDHI